MIACKVCSESQFSSVTSSSGTSRKYPEVGMGVVGTYTHRMTLLVSMSRQVPVTKAGNFVPECGKEISTIRLALACPGCCWRLSNIFRTGL
jgi:hypothetical protein